jgi:hypothetical protein
MSPRTYAPGVNGRVYLVATPLLDEDADMFSHDD